MHFNFEGGTTGVKEHRIIIKLIEHKEYFCRNSADSFSTYLAAECKSCSCLSAYSNQQEGNGPIYLRRLGQLKCDWILAASEATTASKQPQISNMTSDLKSVTPITYLSMCILLIWYGPFWQPPRPPQPPNSLRGQIWPQIWNQWPQLPTYPCAYCLYGIVPFGSLWGHHSLKQPRRSNLTSNLRSATSVTYMSKCILCI